MRRILTRIIIGTAIVLVVLAGVVVGGTILLKDRLINYSIQAINNELNAPVNVDGIHFSLINTFPYASIVLENVTVKSPTEGFSHKGFGRTTADTLLAVRKLSLSFNIRKLLDNELELNSVKVADGQIFILIDKRGNDNFHIIKEKKDKTRNSDMQINLEHLGLKDCKIQVCNLYKGNGAEWYMPDFEAEGKLNNGQFEIGTKGSVSLQWIVANNIEIVPLAPTRIKMDIAMKNDTLRINKGQLSSKGINISVLGTVLLTSDTYVDLALHGDKIEVANALRYFTLATKEKPTVRSSGLVGFDATVKGKFSNLSSPKIVANFGLDNADISYPKLDLELSSVSLKGVFNNGGYANSPKSFVAISGIDVTSGQSHLTGNLRIDNLKQPHINAKLSTNARLEEWNHLIFSDRPDHLTGSADGTLTINGPIDLSTAFDLKAFLRLNPKCQLKMQQASYTNGSNITLTDVNGAASLNGVALTISSTSGRLSNIPLTFSGSINNLLKAVAEPYPTMDIRGTLSTDAFDYQQIEPLFAPSDGEPSKITYKVDLMASTKGFSYKQFRATNISGRLHYAGDNIDVDGLKFNALDGSADVRVAYRSGKHRELACKGSVANVDINQMFSTFDNFSQTTVTNENIEGRLSSNFTLLLPFAGDSADVRNMDFDGRLKITNGRLHGLEALNSVADFTRIDEFRDLRFSTLTNDMTISGGTVTIPKMDVACNACDVAVAGTQKFTGDYEYHITLILSDFMRGKAKRLQQTTPYGIVEDDGGNHTSLYLVATREGDKTKVKFDKVELKQQLRNELQQQKNEVKQILKKEFGLFKKDTTIKTEEKSTTPPPASGFVIEWDDDDDE